MAQHIDADVTVRPRALPVLDHAFEILGRSAVGGIDIATVFAEASARMGDSVWVGCVPVGGRLTCRVRLSKQPIHSGGDTADLVLVLDAQLFRRRLADETFARRTHVLIERELLYKSFNDSFSNSFSNPSVDTVFPGAREQDLLIQPVPLAALANHVPGLADGDRLVALGMLAWVYGREPDTVRKLLENQLASYGGRTVSAALRLFELGWREAPRLVGRRFDLVPPPTTGRRRKVMDGRRALVLGALAAGMNRCHVASSHPLVDGFARVFTAQGGCLVEASGELLTGDGHPEQGRDWTAGRFSGQAADDRRPNARPDEQTAVEHPLGVAPLLTVEASGCPRESDFGAEFCGTFPDARARRDRPKVVVRLERLVPGKEPMFPAWFDPLGPVIGCGPGATDDFRSRPPTPFVFAPTTVEECCQFMALAGRVASHYRRDVIVLVDALLLGAVQGWTSSKQAVSGMAAPLFTAADVLGRSGFGSVGAAASASGAPDVELSLEPCHDAAARRAVDALLDRLQLRTATLETFLRPVPVVGGDDGDVLLIGWGATRGPVEEAVARFRCEGKRVSSVHLRTLHPLPPGLVETMGRFRRVVVVDVMTDRYDATARLRHLTVILRAAVATHSRNGGAAPKTIRLSTYAFSHERPLGPGAVQEFVRVNLSPADRRADDHLTFI